MPPFAPTLGPFHHKSHRFLGATQNINPFCGKRTQKRRKIRGRAGEKASEQHTEPTHHETALPKRRFRRVYRGAFEKKRRRYEAWGVTEDMAAERGAPGPGMAWTAQRVGRSARVRWPPCGTHCSDLSPGGGPLSPSKSSWSDRLPSSVNRTLFDMKTAHKRSRPLDVTDRVCTLKSVIACARFVRQVL